MIKPYQKHIFKNGLRLVTVPMKNTKAVTVLVLVGTGSKYETKEVNGVSHFLEHMFFKGTKKRPNTLDIAEALDKIGGQFNASTDQEITGYWAKVDSGHTDLAIDWLADILLNSKFSPAEITREKGVIIEEINMYLDDPKQYIEWLWNKLLYGDQPQGWFIAGEKEVIKKINRKHFINYLKNHYSSRNTVIVIAGDADKIQNVKSKIPKYFKGINTKNPKNKIKVIEKQNKPEALIYYKNTDQTHLCLGTRSFNIFHKDRYVLALLAAVLGGGMSSRMWISVREKRGLAYYVFSQAFSDVDVGCYVTQAGVNNNKVEEAIKTILKEYKLIKDKKINFNELKKAKDMIRGNSALSMESSYAQASFYATQELTENKILTPEEKLAKIEAVTADDIQRVARDIFRPEKLNLALIGPFKDKNKFQKLLRI